MSPFNSTRHKKEANIRYLKVRIYEPFQLHTAQTLINDACNFILYYEPFQLHTALENILEVSGMSVELIYEPFQLHTALKCLHIFFCLNKNYEPFQLHTAPQTGRLII